MRTRRNIERVANDEGLILARFRDNGVRSYVLYPDPCVVGWRAAVRGARHYRSFQAVERAVNGYFGVTISAERFTRNARRGGWYAHVAS